MQRSEIRSLLADTDERMSFRKTVGRVPIPFLPDAELTVQFEPENVGDDDVVSTVHALSQLDASLRSGVAEALYTACLQSFEDNDADFASPREQLEWVAEDSPEFADCEVP